MNQGILLTGAGGFLGSHLAQRLSIEIPEMVVATVRHDRDNVLKASQPNLTYVTCDLTSPSDVAQLFDHAAINTVIHAAATMPVKNVAPPGLMLRDNVIAQTNLVAQAIAHDVRRYIFFSTISVYEMAPDFDETRLLAPVSPYARAKYVAEQILELATIDSSALSGLTLRLSGLHGSGRRTGVVHSLLTAAIHGQPIKLSEPSSRFRLCFLDDAIDAVLCALKATWPSRYACYNVAGRDSYTLRELADRICKASGSSSLIKAPTSSVIRDQVMPIDRIERDLGYCPRGLDAHLSKMIVGLCGTHGTCR